MNRSVGLVEREVEKYEDGRLVHGLAGPTGPIVSRPKQGRPHLVSYLVTLVAKHPIIDKASHDNDVR